MLAETFVEGSTKVKQRLEKLVKYVIFAKAKQRLEKLVKYVVFAKAEQRLEKLVKYVPFGHQKGTFSMAGRLQKRVEAASRPEVRF